MADTPQTPFRRTPPQRRARAAGTARAHAARRVTRPQQFASGVPGWLLVVCAALAIMVGIVLVVVATIREPVAPVLRLMVPLVWALASGLVFVPLERRLLIPGLGWQGVVGWTLASYVLAFVPAPRGTLLDLPELPTYLVLLLATFYAVTAVAAPVFWVLARRLPNELRLARARRQGYEVALLAVVVVAMAALQVLTVWAFALLVVVLLLTEALLISQWENT